MDAELHKTWVQKNENAKRTPPGNKSKNYFLLTVRVIKIIDAHRGWEGKKVWHRNPKQIVKKLGNKNTLN